MPFFSLSDKNDGLRRWDVEPFPAPNIPADEHIIDADHIVLRVCELCTLLLVQSTRKILFLRAFDPTHVIILPLTAIRARKTCLLYFLPLVEDVTLVHRLHSTTLRAGADEPIRRSLGGTGS